MKIGKFIFFFMWGIIFVFLVGFVIQYLWNVILVEATGVKPLTYWRALGLFVLARILFGGFRFGPKAQRWKKKRNDWKNRWMHMSDDEKADLRSRWKERCGKK